MSEREIEDLRTRIRREKLAVDAERPVFDRSVPPPLADEQTEPKALDMKQLLRLRSPFGGPRPKLKPSFSDMAGGMWPPKIDPGKPLVIPCGPGVAARKKGGKADMTRVRIRKRVRTNRGWTEIVREVTEP